MTHDIKVSNANSWHKFAQIIVFAKVPLNANHFSWLSLGLGAFSGISMGVGYIALGICACTLSIALRSLATALGRVRGEIIWSALVIGSILERSTELLVLMGLIVYSRDIFLLQLALILLSLGSIMIIYSNILGEARGLDCRLLPPPVRRLEKFFILLVTPLFLLLRISFRNDFYLLNDSSVFFLSLLVLATGIAVNLFATLQLKRLIRAIYCREKPAV